jgi:predicted metalloprotease with PDZ domain
VAGNLGVRTFAVADGRKPQKRWLSSTNVWRSRVARSPSHDARTVSYYNKGNVLGLLLDAKIRRTANGRASFDDVLRLAYRRYSGARGFTADEFRQTTQEVAGVDLRRWFASAISSTDELDYTDLLEWYGLRFVTSSGPAGAWTLERHPDQTAAQQQRLANWLGE